MMQIASCEQALIKTVSFQGMQSGPPVFVVGEFGTFEIFFWQKGLLGKA